MIAECTDRNDHNRSILLGVMLVGDTDLENQIQAIIEQHRDVGYMTGEMISSRNKIYITMMDNAKTYLSEADFDTFYQAF